MKKKAKTKRYQGVTLGFSSPSLLEDKSFHHHHPTNHCMFKNSNDTGCSVGLRHPMNSIFKPEEDLNYFDKFMPFLTQNRIFEISSMS